MKTKLLILLVLLFSIELFSQETLYFENFDNQLNKGATGSSPTVDLSGVDWNIDVTDANLSNSYRFIVTNVNGNPLFEARNVGTSIWLSPSTDISAHTDIAFTINASQGGNKLDNGDTLTTEYRIDGGTWTTTTNNGTLNNDYGDIQIGQSGLVGNTLEIRVTAVNNANNERQRIDDIEITGIASCSTPNNPITFNAIEVSSTSVELNWNLNGCNEEYLIVATEASAVTTIPTGDGSLYVANSNFGSGTETVTNEFVVYKGALDNEIVSNLIFGKTYFFKVFARNGTSWSTGTQVDYTIDYCTSVGTRDEYDTNITFVSFGDINNNTVIDDGAGYHDYTAQSTNISIGTSKDLTINIDTDGNFSVYSYVWIDWNRDGDFEDDGETYDLGFSDNTDDGPTTNSPLNIMAPLDAALGSTRMRVMSEYYNQTIPTNGPCDGADDGEIEDYTVTIKPPISYIYDNAWLPLNPNGVSTSVDDITVISGSINFNTNTTCKNLLVNPDGNINIETGVTLTVANEMVLESSSTKYSSLILDGTIIGTTIYKRHVNNAAGTGTTTTANDLVSAPLTGQSFGDFRMQNPNILSGLITGVPSFLFGPFNPLLEVYVNYSAGNDLSTLDAGVGYRTGSTDGTTYSFTGVAETGNVNVPIFSGGISDWNLIGNPYPSYLNVQAFLNEMTTSELIDKNAVGIYGYDGAAEDGWVIYNLATTSTSTAITPGQGFFVNAESSGNLQFTPSMRTIGTDDDFIAGRDSNDLVYLKLNLSNSTDNFTTEFYFNDNASLILDPGYDAVVWNNIAPNFSVYSHLVENNEGLAMALQAMHSDDMLNVTIPLGINATNSSDIVFTISESTIPETVNVYLEDTLENTLTLLTEENYTLSLNSTLSGTGRFYLRFVDSQLNLHELEIDTLNIYANYTSQSIVIEGSLEQQTQLSIYNIHGRLVLNTSLKLDDNQQSINISHLSTGIYVLNVQSNSSIKTKKIVLR